MSGHQAYDFYISNQQHLKNEVISSFRINCGAAAPRRSASSSSMTDSCCADRCGSRSQHAVPSSTPPTQIYDDSITDSAPAVSAYTPRSSTKRCHRLPVNLQKIYADCASSPLRAIDSMRRCWSNYLHHLLITYV